MATGSILLPIGAAVLLGFVDVWYYSGADQPELGPSEKRQTSGAASPT